MKPLVDVDTVMLAESEAVPPDPVQLRPYVASDVGDTVAVPDVAFVPDQAPLASQESAYVELQLSVDDSPAVIDAGSAARLTVGAGAITVMLTESEALPPEPVQLRLYVASDTGDTVTDPVVAFVPDQAPDASQLPASVDDQLSVDDSPAVIDVGSAVRLTVGAGALLATLTLTEPAEGGPKPLQSRT